MNADPIIRRTEGAVPMEKALTRIESILGLRFQQHQWSDLLRQLKPAVQELGLKDTSECVAWLAEGDISADAIRVLGKHLTIGESYFFREIVVFSLLKEHVIPDIIARKSALGSRQIRVWSAGCSTGEEVYSLAILLDSLLEKMDGWSYTVLGTDINPVSIDRARTGVYREWSFRDIADGIMQTYFTPEGDGKHAVLERIRRNTEFQYLNLVEAPQQYPAGFDIVMCRNVLMYFTRPSISSIVQGFRRSVVESGWLIPSLTETTLINNPGFEGVRFGDATLFRKQAQVAHILSRMTQKEPQPPSDPEPTATGRRKSFTSILPWNKGGKEHGTTEKTEPTAGRETQASAFEVGAQRMAPRKPLPVLDYDGALKGREDELPLAASITPGSSPLLGKAMKLADEGKLDEALVAAKNAVEDAKMDANARFIYATILRESGETSRAMQEFHRALYLDPHFIPAHFAMGSLYRHLGEHDRAQRHLRNALQLLKSFDDMNTVIVPGEISAGHMIDMIQTMIGN